MDSHELAEWQALERIRGVERQAAQDKARLQREMSGRRGGRKR